MAKRLSQTNTLLNYFQSPKAKQLKSKRSNTEETCETQLQPDGSEDEIAPIKKKRTRILPVDDDSDGENIDPPKPIAKKARVDDLSTRTSSSKLKNFAFSSERPTTTLPVKSESNKSLPGESCYDDDDGEKGKWLHEKLPFLKADKIKDASGKKASDPNYDKTTLLVPKEYLNTLTPAMRQWWILKSEHFDTVLFFKVGKFYELYHMDATVGVQHLGFSYMKGEFAHSGFPEIGYGRMASMLVEKGFKVARVEQTETPEMMTERCKNLSRPSKFDKVVQRELCQISQKGVCMHGSQTLDPQQARGCYMIAICEEQCTETSWKHFGVCFIDISVGVFHLAEFDDDKHCSRLLTIAAQHNLALILLERGVKSDTMMLIGTHLQKIKVEILAAKKEFPEASSTLETLKSECYFKDEAGNHEWPEIFDQLLEEKSFPRLEYVNCLKSLGACIWYLKKSLIDVHVVQMKRFSLYVPIDLQSKMASNQTHSEYMVVDSVTLENLHLLGDAGSLQKTLDYCSTAFGKRLLQMWICRPLCDTESITKRQVAVKELFENPQLLKTTRELMATLPDIERQLVKIHHFGNAFVAKNHPDARAVLYEAKTYSKRKIGDLMSTLEAFAMLRKLTSLFAASESRLLRKLTQLPPEGVFVDLQAILAFFKGAFDHLQAKQEGVIIPQKGVDAEYDRAQAQIKCVQEDLDEYLDAQQRFFKCDVKYFGTDKKRFQLEVPERYCKKATREYQLEGSKKGSKPCNRYSTERSRDLLAAMLKAEKVVAKIVLDLNRRIFQRFADSNETWEKALLCATSLDCLCSLAEYARLQNEDVCMPIVRPFCDLPVCRMENARHPCIDRDRVKLVANDVALGDGKQPLMILTGPNMGGKSTFMRQTVIIAIMAQIGSYVPASTCELSLIDRIFTRMGGHDDIMRGRSTFLVELAEASAILRHASRHSFVVLDELGRGTSTYDGNAIAMGYLRELASIQCRGLFATHYHTLVQMFEQDTHIQLGYMTCLLQDEGSENERVVFLYKVAQGLWPKSYGFHVALLAGLSLSDVNEGRKYSAAMERKEQNRRFLQSIDNLEEVLKICSI